jgi:hypothetical protein
MGACIIAQLRRGSIKMDEERQLLFSDYNRMKTA